MSGYMEILVIAIEKNKEGAESPFLETLTFTPHDVAQSNAKVTSDVNTQVTCLFCDEMYDVTPGTDKLLKHMAIEHKLVIGDVKLIADFKSYLDYWRNRFKEKPLTEFCAMIQTNSTDANPDNKELYYFLCDSLSEDKELRMKLQKLKLEEVLAQQQKEREDVTFSRGCLFCKQQFEKNRANLFNHMAEDHNFSVGQPDNLVYINELLDLLQEKLHKLKCLYCERTFKDRHVLKEHMRKKAHKRLRAKNPTYDKFYLINYLELGKNWEQIQSEEDVESDLETDSDNNSDWGDWKDEVGNQAVCLFCNFSTSSTDTLTDHMKEVHRFEFVRIKNDLGLGFYQQVKLINFIRRQVHQKVCFYCQERYPTKEDLLNHLQSSDHVTTLPPASLWDQPEYYFPTYENDHLLCALGNDDEEELIMGEGGSGSDVTAEGNVIIAEDIPVTQSILQETRVLQDLLQP